MKKKVFIFCIFSYISTSLNAQILDCIAPSAGAQDCYQTSRVVGGSSNPLWNWPPIPHQDCCNALSLSQPRNEVIDGLLIPPGASTGSPFFPGCVQDELPDDAFTCFGNNEKATTWYKFVITPRPGDDTTIGTPAGKLRFKILPRDIYQPGILPLVPIPPYPGDSLDQGGTGYGNMDYDFLLFKVTGEAGSGDRCTAIKNSTAYNTPGSVIARCNYTGTRGPTGLFEPGVGIDMAGFPVARFNAPLDVKVGDIFYLAVDNFSVSLQGFFVDFRTQYPPNNLYAENDQTARVGFLSNNPTAIRNLNIQSELFQIYPNPCLNEAHIKLNTILKDATLKLINYCGQIVKSEEKIHGNSILVSTNNLSAGLYTILIMEKDILVGTKKLVISN